MHTIHSIGWTKIITQCICQSPPTAGRLREWFAHPENESVIQAPLRRTNSYARSLRAQTNSLRYKYRSRQIRVFPYHIFVLKVTPPKSFSTSWQVLTERSVFFPPFPSNFDPHMSFVFDTTAKKICMPILPHPQLILTHPSGQNWITSYLVVHKKKASSPRALLEERIYLERLALSVKTFLTASLSVNSLCHLLSCQFQPFTV